MTQQTAPSKSQLLDDLRSNERQLLDRLSALPAEDFEAGRYENGWNAREILAHVASMEWTYQRLIDVARDASSAGGSASPRDSKPGGGTPTRSVRGGIGSYNQRQVDKRAGASVEELLDEFRQNRAATIAAVEKADVALLATPIRSAGGITGPLARVIHLTAVMHTQIHVNDIVGG